MANMISCRICGRLFESVSISDICDICKVKDDEIYKTLREYLILHPGSKIFDVSNELNIPILYIKRYLREERLEIVEKNNCFLTCVDCGTPIRSGQCCDKCAADKKNGSKAAFSSSFSKDGEDLNDYSSNSSLKRIKYVNNSFKSGRRIPV